jgi:hypothetical protein
MKSNDDPLCGEALRGVPTSGYFWYCLCSGWCLGLTGLCECGTLRRALYWDEEGDLCGLVLSINILKSSTHAAFLIVMFYMRL